jgi:cytochrome b561
MANPVPVLPKRPQWEVWAASLGHWGLYAVMFIMPISGYIMSMAGGHGVNVFGVWELPNLIGENPTLGKLANQTHDITTKIIYVLVATHVLAALRHHFLLRDGVLVRMLPFLKPLSK